MWLKWYSQVSISKNRNNSKNHNNNIIIRIGAAFLISFYWTSQASLLRISKCPEDFCSHCRLPPFVKGSRPCGEATGGLCQKRAVSVQFQYCDFSGFFGWSGNHPGFWWPRPSHRRLLHVGVGIISEWLMFFQYGPFHSSLRTMARRQWWWLATGACLVKNEAHAHCLAIWISMDCNFLQPLWPMDFWQHACMACCDCPVLEKAETFFFASENGWEWSAASPGNWTGRAAGALVAAMKSSPKKPAKC